MTTPTTLAELIRRTAGEDLPAETSRGVLFQAPLDTPVLRAAWLALCEAPPAYLASVVLTRAGTDLELTKDEPIEIGVLYQISLTKTAAPGELRLFFAQTLAEYPGDLAQVEAVRIAELAAEETFATLRHRIEPWTEDLAGAFAPAEPLPDPRAFVRDFTGSSTVPSDLRPWLRRGPPTRIGESHRQWRALAAPRLLAALADEVSGQGGTLVYHLSGPPKRLIADADGPVAEAAFDALTQAADWVYAEGLRDAETRHLLFANEWARTALRVPDASVLASAKSAYGAYVKAGSKETLKALADLRKAVIEETQKASQRAQDLTAGLWKDLAVAASPFVLKIFADSAKADSVEISAALAVGAAVFLVLSLSAQLWINHRYFAHQGKARGVWRSTLNTVLSADDIKAFSETPITDTERDYLRVACGVVGIYGVLVVILIVFAAANLTAPAVLTTPTADGTELNQVTPG